MSAYELTQEQWRKVMGNNPSFFKSCGGDCPVEQVSWNDIQEFINKLNRITGKNYRLPTDAEWEYACRAGTTTKWYCGDDESCVDGTAWYGENSGDAPHPVGEKEPNAWGLYDMAGNIWEWCQDWYDANYYAVSPSTDPQGPDSGTKRVWRGGGWNYATSFYCRSSFRDRYYPEDGFNFAGFRLALDE
jgi:formylglycine-generating enzyme required for sulfatase activity